MDVNVLVRNILNQVLSMEQPEQPESCFCVYTSWFCVFSDQLPREAVWSDVLFLFNIILVIGKLGNVTRNVR